MSNVITDFADLIYRSLFAQYPAAVINLFKVTKLSQLKPGAVLVVHDFKKTTGKIYIVCSKPIKIGTDSLIYVLRQDAKKTFLHLLPDVLFLQETGLVRYPDGSFAVDIAPFTMPIKISDWMLVSLISEVINRCWVAITSDIYLRRKVSPFFKTN